jgi:hypothetical protein
MQTHAQTLTLTAALGLVALSSPAATRVEPGAVTFQEIAAQAGVGFVLRNGALGQKHLPETMAGGIAVFDYNRDGRPDLFFVNGAEMPSLNKPGPEYQNRLYRNEGGGKFSDTTAAAGVGGAGYGIGAATGDFDNDGFPDLFVAGVYRNTLYRNQGDGTFADVTQPAGLAAGGKEWAVAAAWLDYDSDGWLDLFVVNYVQWDPGREPFCGHHERDYRVYCHPRLYEGLPNRLYRNNGDGTFRDVSEASGIAAHVGKGMGAAVADYDGDGRTDIFVANDTVPNFLFRNRGGGRFDEAAIQAGVAFNDNGRAVSSMGADFRDLDNDGRPDIFVTALANQTFPWFRNLDNQFFEDITYRSGIAKASLDWSGWGTGAYDFNNDGWKDLFVAAGDVQDNAEVFSSLSSQQPNRLFLNRRDGSFLDGSAAAGPDFQKTAMHRGAAFADFDGDGRIDVAVSRIGEPAAVFLNTTSSSNHWIAFRLQGSKSNREAIGARIRLVAASGETQWNQVTTSVGYASSSDTAVHFGLGEDAAIKEVEIRWPSGAVQMLRNLEVDRYHQIQEPAP